MTGDLLVDSSRHSLWRPYFVVILQLHYSIHMMQFLSRGIHIFIVCSRLVLHPEKRSSYFVYFNLSSGFFNCFFLYIVRHRECLYYLENVSSIYFLFILFAFQLTDILLALLVFARKILGLYFPL